MSEDVRALVSRAREDGPGRVRAAARLMSLVENAPERLPELLAGCADWPQPRMVLGLTGPPGAGKSVLTDHLVAGFRRRHPDRRVGVIAADASSPFSGGALLGDRVRMMRHAADPLVFIRSAASRGHVGGLMLGVRGMVQIMGLVGCDVVVLETVGVGQSEVEVASVADVVLIVLAPGLGDGIQLLKCGLMEIGDVIVINKADREGAKQLYAELLATLRLAETARRPRPCLVSAAQDQGMEDLLDLLEQRCGEDGERWAAGRRDSLEAEVREAVFEEARRLLARALEASPEQIRRVLRGDVTVRGLVQELLPRIAGEQPIGSAIP